MRWLHAVLLGLAASVPTTTTTPPPPPPSVQVGAVVEIGYLRLRPCAIEAVSFRTRDEGWVTDACGHAFQTNDGGMAFRPLPKGAASLALATYAVDGESEMSASGHISRLEWLTERDGVAFTNEGRSVLITADAGATWRRSPLPTDDWIYATDHLGQSIWACGSSGAIFRSREGGRSFSRTSHTPFNGDDRCMALSFLDEQRGWAGGMDGTLYRTDDGGDSWSKLRPPRRAVKVAGVSTTDGGAVYDFEVTGLVRVAARAGWIALEKSGQLETFVTRDGVSWAKARPPATLAAKLENGSRWGDGAVIQREGRLRFYSGDALIRETPLVFAPERRQEQILGIERLASGHLGAWTDHAIIESFDDGRSWSTISRTSAATALRRVVHADGQILAELANGRLVDGESLRPSDQPEFDRFRMALVEATRQSAPLPAGPVSCMAGARTGDLRVRLGSDGCEYSRTVEARLTWADGVATLSWDFGAAQSGALPEPEWRAVARGLPGAKPRPLSEVERAQIVRAIAAGVERGDDGDHGCTSHVSADLDWQCGTAPRLRASFDESDCALPGQSPAHGPAHRVRALLLPLLDPKGTTAGAN